MHPPVSISACTRKGILWMAKVFSLRDIEHFDDAIPREWWQDDTQCIVLEAQSLTKGCVHLFHLGDTQVFPETRFAVSFLH